MNIFNRITNKINDTRKNALVILFLMILSSCHHTDKSSAAKIDPIKNTPVKKNIVPINTLRKANINSEAKFIDSTIGLGFAYGFINDSVEKKPDTIHISKKQFLKYKQSDTTAKVVYDVSKINISRKAFIIKTAKKLQKFERDSIKKDDNDISYSTYRGFFDPLKLYLYEDKSNGEFELSRLRMIDSVNNKTYELGSNHDESSEIPLFSPHLKFMVFYSNEMIQDPESILNIIKLNKDAGGYIYSNFTAIKSSNWEIKNLAWIDDTNIALEVKPFDHWNYTKRRYDKFNKVYLRYRIHNSYNSSH